MRSTYLLFVIALLCAAALAYVVTRPPTLSNEMERRIVAHIDAALANQKSAQPSSPRMDSAAVQDIVRSAVEAALEQYETQRLQDGGSGATVVDDADRMLVLQQEQEERRRRMRRANAEVMAFEAARIGSDIQVWQMKPVHFGGGNTSRPESGFGALTLRHIGYADLGFAADNDSLYVTSHGRYHLEVSPDTVRVIGLNWDFRNRVVTTITGMKSTEMNTKIYHLE